MNQELLDVQAEFRKGRGSRDQIANIHWIIEKARDFQKNIYTSASLTRLKPLTVWITTNWKFFKRWNTRPPYLPPVKHVCRSRSKSEKQAWNSGLVPNWERSDQVYTVTLFI